MSLQKISADVIVVGAGGAGLRAALSCLEHGLNTLCLSKVQATRSHTVAAQGGINAPLGNRTPDDWRWLMYDTVRGSDWLGDQDAIETLARHASEAVRELEHWGVPFTRDDAGKIYQRAYGGQSTHFGKGDLAYRACAAADRTGHAMLHTLYGRALKAGLRLKEEWFVVDLLRGAHGNITGVLAWDMDAGELWQCEAKITLLATGGYGQVYSHTTSSSICTGDGNAMVLRAGLPLQDMEFVQFHPTGLYGTGCLITEGARGEGGMLLNGEGERFMQRYAPHYGDLASRDVIARAMMQEVLEGRGAGSAKDHLWLDVRHLDAETHAQKIPTVVDLARRFARVDAATGLIPVIPCVHYTMGGIPANYEGRVMQEDGSPVEGLLAVGEAACNSVHGANRLGCNSLLDLLVFGKKAGELAASICQKSGMEATGNLDERLSLFHHHRTRSGDETPTMIRRDIQRIMHAYAGIVRDAASMARGMAAMQQCWERFRHCGIADHSLIWNQNLAEKLECENLLLQATATLAAAAERTESRGAHYRSDHPKRNDADWLKHSLTYVTGSGQTQSRSKPVSLTSLSGEIAPIVPEDRGY